MSPLKTVLIIDDESEFREILGKVLGENGWRVWRAADGGEGIQLAKTHQPAVVLCDLLMAPGNGFHFCRALRRVEALRQTRVVILSGRGFPSDRQAALEAGADEFITKPIDAPALLALLARLTGDAGEPGPASNGGLPMRVKFWGVRGSIPTPGPGTVEYGGNTSCVEVRAEGQIIILDAGTGLRLLGRALLDEFGERPLDLTLLLTHTHWDHIQGIPFFRPVYLPQNRLRVLGYEGARHGLNTVLASQMESPLFPIGLREVPANVSIEELKELAFNLGPVQVRACFANHPGVCVGYKLTAGGGSFVFFPDNELRPSTNGIPTGPAANEPAAAFARHEHQKLIEFIRGADVLVMDAQYDCEEYRQHVGWGHGCIEPVVELALQAEVKCLFLFHHDPDHDDAKVSQMVEHARQVVAERQGSLRIEGAREGATVEIPPVRPG